MNAAACDVIGDIHGQLAKLEALLCAMGYRRTGGSWRHPGRTALFVGDFFDRGPSQVDTYRLVRSMIDDGHALATMGNHEFNAIAWHSADGAGGFCRAHSHKNRRQHHAFLSEVEADPDLHAEIVDWCLTLPLWLDLPGLRVVHACWHEPSMGTLGGPLLSRDAVRAASRHGSREHAAIETLLKGVEVPLPDGAGFTDKDGNLRHEVRVRWWADHLTRYDEAALPLPGNVAVPAVPLEPEVLCGYDRAKPLFLGHYWMTGTPALLSDHIACVDYSAGKDGPLVAYRWNGEAVLDPAGFVAAG